MTGDFYTRLKKLTETLGMKLINAKSDKDLAVWIGVIALALIDEDGYIREKFVKELIEDEGDK